MDVISVMDVIGVMYVIGVMDVIGVMIVICILNVLGVINNYWMRLSVISIIIKAKVGVICRSRRLR